MAALIKADPSEIVFTAGGTESDNFAIRGAAEALEPTGRRHLVASAIEHEAVLNTLKALGETRLAHHADPGEPVRRRLAGARARGDRRRHGARLGHAREQRDRDHSADRRRSRRIAHERGALMHTDAVQSAGKLPVDVRALGVDLLSLSAHKFNGPKGAGVLYIRRGTRMQPLLTGGKHERNRRAGTENTPAIAGMGVAARQAMQKMEAEAVRLAALRDRLEARHSGGGAGHGGQRRRRRRACRTRPMSASIGSRPRAC